jgi:hypothetical protein
MLDAHFPHFSAVSASLTINFCAAFVDLGVDG